MKRKLLCALTALILALTFVSACAEVSVPCAGAPYALDALERYDSFLLDESSGEWSVGDPTFQAVIDAIAEGEARGNMNAGVLAFQFALSGNLLTGAICPSLEFVFFASAPISARAVSLLIGGVRYDFETACERISLGGYPAEKLTAPLTAETLSLIPAIREAETVTVLVHGAEKAYLADLSRGGDNKSAKEKLEAASLSCTALYDDMPGLNADGYALWDLTAAQWKARFGDTLSFVATGVSEAGAYDEWLPTGMRILYAGARGDGLAYLTEELSAKGFFAGAAETVYGAKTASAVARAQRYFGLPVTGGADAALLAALASGSAAPAVSESLDASAALSSAQISIGRWWAAGAVAPSENLSASVSRGDADDALIVCEGRVKNAGASELGLGWQLTGAITLDGMYTYACAVRAECDAGRSFTTSLLPLSETRLIVTAEVPASALESAASVELALSLDGETISYTLSK